MWGADETTPDAKPSSGTSVVQLGPRQVAQCGLGLLFDLFAMYANIAFMSRPKSEQSLGSEIGTLRTKAGLTLREFARRIDISAAHQSDIEHDRRRPGPEVLLRIVAELSGVGASLDVFEKLNTQLDPETRRWLAETPAARQMLRAVRESNRDPREILRSLEQASKEPTEKE